MIKKIKQLILEFRVYRWNLWFGDNEYQIDCDTYEKLMKQYKSEKKKATNESINNIGLKEIKFCKFCGSKNIIQTTGYYKHYNCLNCGSKSID